MVCNVGALKVWGLVRLVISSVLEGGEGVISGGNDERSMCIGE
jgi:hypothetical protein